MSRAPAETLDEWEWLPDAHGAEELNALEWGEAELNRGTKHHGCARPDQVDGFRLGEDQEAGTAAEGVVEMTTPNPAEASCSEKYHNCAQPDPPAPTYTAINEAGA